MIQELFIISSLALFFIGLYGIIVKSNVVRILLALNILETGVNLFLVAIGFKEKGVVPIIKSLVNSENVTRFVDPLPHALVLTSIVIGFGTTALALALFVRHYSVFGKKEIEHEQEGKITE